KPLRRESFPYPPLAVASEPEPVVHPVVASLPELDYLRANPVAAPVCRTPDKGVAARLHRPGIPCVQLLPVRDHPGLRRRDRTELRPTGPAGEVGVRLAGGEPLRRTLDPNLALDRVPQHRQCRVRFRLQVAALARVVVAV